MPPPFINVNVPLARPIAVCAAWQARVEGVSRDTVILRAVARDLELDLPLPQTSCPPPPLAQSPTSPDAAAPSASS